MVKGAYGLFVPVLAVLLLSLSGCFGTGDADSAGYIESESHTVLSVSSGSGSGDIGYYDLTENDGEVIRYAAQSFTVDDQGCIYILNAYERTVKTFRGGAFSEMITLPEGDEYIDVFFDAADGAVKVLDIGGGITAVNGNAGSPVRAAAAKSRTAGDSDDENSCGVNSMIRGADGSLVVKYDDNIHVGNDAAEGAAIDALLDRIDVSFSSGTGYKSFIGYDSGRNAYILTTELLSNEAGDMETEQKILRFSPSLERTGEILLGQEKEFVVAHRNVFVSAKGEVYRLRNLPEKVTVSLLAFSADSGTNAPEIMKALAQKEAKSFSASRPAPLRVTGVKLTRDQLYTRASAAANLSWTYTPSKNKSTSSSVTLPSQLRSLTSTTTMKGMPYCWGGWNTTSQFTTNIANSYMAGNVYCDGGYKSRTAGTDCSGFVSIVIGASEKLSTSAIASSDLFSTISASNLVKMDVLNKGSSHVLFYVSTLSDGNIRTLESTTGTSSGGIQGVKFYTRSLSGLTNSGYVAKRYKNISGSSISFTVPSGLAVDKSSTFSGTCSSDIVKITRLVSGSTVHAVTAPSGGTFSFDVLFSSAGTKTLTVYGYTSSGTEVSASKTITVNSTINFTVPSVRKVNTTVTFPGTCSSDIVTIKRLVEGSTVRDVAAPSNGTFSFDVIFSSAESKTLTVYGYDSNGREVTASRTFTVTN